MTTTGLGGLKSPEPARFVRYLFIPEKKEASIPCSTCELANTMAVSSFQRPDCYHTRATFTYLVVYFTLQVFGAVVSLSDPNSPLLKRDEWDPWFGQDSAPTNFELTSASQNNQFDTFASDDCTFTLAGCPTKIDASPVAFDFGLPGGVGDGGCDETLEGCSSLFNDWSTTSNSENLDMPISFDGGVDMGSGVTIAQGGSAAEAQDMKNRLPTVYYDCDPNYTSCIIYDRSLGPQWNRKASVLCPSDVDFSGTDLAGTSVTFRRPGSLFALPGWHCEFCFEDGTSCQLLECDLSLLPSKYNNWGQKWGTCTEESCSCMKNIQAFNDYVTSELIASNDNLGPSL